MTVLLCLLLSFYLLESAVATISTKDLLCSQLKLEILRLDRVLLV